MPIVDELRRKLRQSGATATTIQKANTILNAKRELNRADGIDNTNVTTIEEAVKVGIVPIEPPADPPADPGVDPIV